MPIPRKVVKQKAQLLVAIPPELRKKIGVTAGTTLYWHEHRLGEAVITRNPQRRGGKAPDPMKSAAIAALEAEVNRLNARLERQRASLWNEWNTQAALKRMHLELKGYPALDAINDRLRHIEDILGAPRRRGTLKLPRGVVAIDLPPSDAAEPEENTRASAPPSP